MSGTINRAAAQTKKPPREITQFVLGCGRSGPTCAAPAGTPASRPSTSAADRSMCCSVWRASTASLAVAKQLLDGRWTAGDYLGWRLLPGVRFDAGVARWGGIRGAALWRLRAS